MHPLFFHKGSTNHVRFLTMQDGKKTAIVKFQSRGRRPVSKALVGDLFSKRHDKCLVLGSLVWPLHSLLSSFWRIQTPEIRWWILTWLVWKQAHTFNSKTAEWGKHSKVLVEALLLEAFKSRQAIFPKDKLLHTIRLLHLMQLLLIEFCVLFEAKGWVK